MLLSRSADAFRICIDLQISERRKRKKKKSFKNMTKVSSGQKRVRLDNGHVRDSLGPCAARRGLTPGLLSSLAGVTPPLPKSRYGIHPKYLGFSGSDRVPNTNVDRRK